jgi:hypothetical protein
MIIRLDSRKLDHPGPLIGLLRHELSELGGRLKENRGPQLGELRLELGIAEPGIDLPVELLDDLSGRIPGHADAIPPAYLIAWNEMPQSPTVSRDRFPQHSLTSQPAASGLFAALAQRVATQRLRWQSQ